MLRTSLSLISRIKKCNYGLAFTQVTKLVSFLMRRNVVLFCHDDDLQFAETSKQCMRGFIVERVLSQFMTNEIKKIITQHGLG